MTPSCATCRWWEQQDVLSWAPGTAGLCCRHAPAPVTFPKLIAYQGGDEEDIGDTWNVFAPNDPCVADVSWPVTSHRDSCGDWELTREIRAPEDVLLPVAPAEEA